MLKNPNNRVIFKAIATILVATAMLYPLWGATKNETGNNGILSSLGTMDWIVTSAIVITFIVGVAIYCRSLQKCLSLVQPSCQAMKPKMVWLMFVPFYNIVEDFFIIQNVTLSIEQEARTNERLKAINNFGRLSGFGWCIAQVAALFPSLIGEAASFIALFFWIAHWRLIEKVNNLLTINSLDQRI